MRRRPRSHCPWSPISRLTPRFLSFLNDAHDDREALVFHFGTTRVHSDIGIGDAKKQRKTGGGVRGSESESESDEWIWMLNHAPA
jgi:hypothetical protein